MKRQLFVGVGLVVGLASWAANDVQAQAAAAQDTKAKATTVTGCLAKGTDANSYMLNDATSGAAASAAKEVSKEPAKSGEMKNYVVMVKDASLKLDNHVGHKVTLTGTVEEMAFSPAPGGAKPGASAGTTGKAGSAHLMVTSMKHVAPTCTP
jgi:hypothetical protein